MDQTFNDLGAVEGLWFKNYVAMIAYDPKRTGGPSSPTVISKRGRADLETEIVVSLTIFLDF
jgi:hypothetical protein